MTYYGAESEHTCIQWMWNYVKVQNKRYLFYFMKKIIWNLIFSSPKTWTSNKQINKQLTVSSGCKISSFSQSLIKNTTSGYAKRGGAPNTNGGFGDLNVIHCSLCDVLPLQGEWKHENRIWKEWSNGNTNLKSAAKCWQCDVSTIVPFLDFAASLNSVHGLHNDMCNSLMDTAQKACSE